MVLPTRQNNSKEVGGCRKDIGFQGKTLICINIVEAPSVVFYFCLWPYKLLTCVDFLVSDSIETFHHKEYILIDEFRYIND